METTRSSDCWLSLDALRAVAVILMLEQHLGVWFTALVVRGRPVSSWMILLNQLGGLAAPLFVVISAFSAALGSRRTPVATLVRGLGLMVIGTCLHLLVPSWFSPASFYILSLLGVATLSTIALRRLPSWGALCVGLAILWITPLPKAT